MIRYNIKKLIAEKEFREKRRISIKEIAQEVGMARITLSKIANNKGAYNTSASNIERLCQYFGCTPDDLMTIIPDEPESTQKPTPKGQE